MTGWLRKVRSWLLRTWLEMITGEEPCCPACGHWLGAHAPDCSRQ